MLVPAWAYLYTKACYPQRGIVAWAALPEGSICRRVDAVQHIAETFGISQVNARVLVRKGEGTFWHVDGKEMEVFSGHDLWQAVADESIVPEEEYVNVPDEALGSILLTRAYLAQPTLTRGPAKPISVAVSGAAMGRAPTAITRYRQRLAAEGRLETVPQYMRLREEEFGLHAQPLAAGEYVKKGWVYRRTADIVVITNRLGELLLWPVHKVKDRVMAARKFFPSTKKLEGWVAAGQKVAKDAMLLVLDEWIPVANVCKGGYRDLLYTTNTYSKKIIHEPANVRRQSSLAGGGCNPALQGV